MTGPTKQPPPPHVLNAGNTAGKLARTWNWKLIIIGAVATVAILWQFENGIVEWAKGVYYSRAANPAEGAMPEVPPENEREQRRTYADMQREVEQQVETRIEEAVKKVEEKAAEKEKQREEKAARTERAEKKEPTLQDIARDGQIGGGIVVAEVLADPDGDEEMAEGGDDFGGLESNGIRRVSLRSQAGGGKSDADGSEFVAGSDCQVNMGTPIRVRLLTSIDTARGGGQAIGKVVGNVYDTATGKCLAIPNESTFYGDVATTTVKNQKAAEITFTSLTRPYPRNDTLSFPMPASDSMGRGGVEGRINSNLSTNIALIAIATAVEILPALVGGDDASLLGTAIRGFLGGSETPLNRAAREQFEKPSTIELDQNNSDDRSKAEITVILRRHINADEFRSSTAPQRTNANKRRARG